MGKVFIIAEAGVNHNGDVAIAKKMIDAASEVGADAVKFQMFHTDSLVCSYAVKAKYQQTNDSKIEHQAEMLRKLELTEEEQYELFRYCEKKRIMFLSTPFDNDSIKLLVSMGVMIIKIPSGEITNFPYLREIGKTQKEVILSTGMSTIEEIESAVNVLKEYGTRKLTLLHCNTQYPTPMQDVNLKAMLTLSKVFDVNIGYSDHTVGIEVPIAAVTLGATVIEKHFTLDRNMEGPDHKASLEPDELGKMISAIRNIEQAIGKDIKRVTDSERENREIVRKSIVASRTIKKGEMFTEENITAKRPGIGMDPMRWNEVLGVAANKDYEVDEMIQI